MQPSQLTGHPLPQFISLLPIVAISDRHLRRADSHNLPPTHPNQPNRPPHYHSSHDVLTFDIQGCDKKYIYIKEAKKGKAAARLRSHKKRTWLATEVKTTSTMQWWREKKPQQLRLTTLWRYTSLDKSFEKARESHQSV